MQSLVWNMFAQSFLFRFHLEVIAVGWSTIIDSQNHSNRFNQNSKLFNRDKTLLLSLLHDFSLSTFSMCIDSFTTELLQLNCSIFISNKRSFSLKQLFNRSVGIFFHYCFFSLNIQINHHLHASSESTDK